MRKLLLLMLLALAFPASASTIEYNDTYFKEHWPTTTMRLHGCVSTNPEARCIKVFNRTPWGGWRYRSRLTAVLADFNNGDPGGRFLWRRDREPMIDLNTDAGVRAAYTSKYFGGIVIGYAGCTTPDSCGHGDWEVDVSFGEMNGDPEMGDLPDWYAAPDSVEHTGLCFIAVDNKSRASIEHEIGHCMGLSHWPLQGFYECPVFSVMCGLGSEYDHLAWKDFRTLDYLYGHTD